MSGVELRLRKHRNLWECKPSLRAIYTDYHRRLITAVLQGEPLLEIGGGSGNLKDLMPNAISIDLVESPWTGICCDAHSMPFSDGYFSGIIMLDVLHHLARPAVFFDEVTRVLRPGGRLAMIEPSITPFSWPFYKFFHEEPVNMFVDPLANQAPEVEKDPFCSNQALPTLLFGRKRFRRCFELKFPELKIIKRYNFSLFAYPLSGGFKRWSLMPRSLVNQVLDMEEFLNPLLGFVFGFRIAVILERV